MKLRHGGPEVRRERLNLRAFEQRVLDGDVRAVRALVRQAMGPNTLDTQFDGRVELRAVPNGTGGSRLLFTGYASVVETPYTMWDWIGSYTEIVREGAFAKTLADNPDVIFCLNHGWDGAPMARTAPGTLRLSADSTGLATEADLDPGRSDVNIVRSAMDAGELDAMSFAFYTTRQTWSPDYEQRDILEVDLDGGDTSVVTWPANPTTTGTTALRSQQARSLVRSRVLGVLTERARAEKRADDTLSDTTMETLQSVLDLIAEADVNLDAAQPLLAELMGVDNPDDELDATSAADSSTDSGAQTNSAPAMGLTRMRLLEDQALRQPISA